MEMKIVFLLACFLYSANAGITTGYAKWIPNDAQTGQTLEEQQKQSPHKLLTLSDVKKMICGKSGWRSNEGTTEEDPKFHLSGGPIKYDKTNVELHLSNSKEYFGSKIDVDCETEVMNKTAFSIDAWVVMTNHSEEYDLRMVGLLNGKDIDKKGTLKVSWDRIEIQFEAEVDPGSPDFQNVSVDAHCGTQPTLEIKGLPESSEVDKAKLYATIFDIIEKGWGKSLATIGDSEKIKNFSTCRKTA